MSAQNALQRSETETIKEKVTSLTRGYFIGPPLYLIACDLPVCNYRMTFVLSHGFMEHGGKTWIKKLKNELLKHGDHNVIILNSIRCAHKEGGKIFETNNFLIT